MPIKTCTIETSLMWHPPPKIITKLGQVNSAKCWGGHYLIHLLMALINIEKEVSITCNEWYI